MMYFKCAVEYENTHKNVGNGLSLLLLRARCIFLLFVCVNFRVKGLRSLLPVCVWRIIADVM